MISPLNILAPDTTGPTGPAGSLGDIVQEVEEPVDLGSAISGAMSQTATNIANSQVEDQGYQLNEFNRKKHLSDYEVGGEKSFYNANRLQQEYNSLKALHDSDPFGDSERYGKMQALEALITERRETQHDSYNARIDSDRAALADEFQNPAYKDLSGNPNQPRNLRRGESWGQNSAVFGHDYSGMGGSGRGVGDEGYRESTGYGSSNAFNAGTQKAAAGIFGQEQIQDSFNRQLNSPFNPPQGDSNFTGIESLYQNTLYS